MHSQSTYEVFTTYIAKYGNYEGVCRWNDEEVDVHIQDYSSSGYQVVQVWATKFHQSAECRITVNLA